MWNHYIRHMFLFISFVYQVSLTWLWYYKKVFIICNTQLTHCRDEIRKWFYNSSVKAICVIAHQRMLSFKKKCKVQTSKFHEGGRKICCGLILLLLAWAGLWRSVKESAYWDQHKYAFKIFVNHTTFAFCTNINICAFFLGGRDVQSN